MSSRKRAPGLSARADPLGDAEVGLLVEVAERREHRVGAVELLLERHLAHVGVDEVHGQRAPLRLVGGADQQRQRQVEPGHVVARAARARWRGGRSRSRRRGSRRPAPSAQRVRDELDLAQRLVGAHERQRAQVVLVEDLLEPRLGPLRPARALRERLRQDRAAWPAPSATAARGTINSGPGVRRWLPGIGGGAAFFSVGVRNDLAWAAGRSASSAVGRVGVASIISTCSSPSTSPSAAASAAPRLRRPQRRRRQVARPASACIARSAGPPPSRRRCAALPARASARRRRDLVGLGRGGGSAAAIGLE